VLVFVTFAFSRTAHWTRPSNLRYFCLTQTRLVHVQFLGCGILMIHAVASLQIGPNDLNQFLGGLPLW
jgi:hypothetical protein